MDRMRNLDVGALILGALILFVGVYYLFDRTLGFNLPDLNWDQIWPIAVIAIGAGILWKSWAGRRLESGSHVH